MMYDLSRINLDALRKAGETLECCGVTATTDIYHAKSKTAGLAWYMLNTLSGKRPDPDLASVIYGFYLVEAENQSRDRWGHTEEYLSPYVYFREVPRPDHTGSFEKVVEDLCDLEWFGTPRKRFVAHATREEIAEFTRDIAERRCLPFYELGGAYFYPRQDNYDPWSIIYGYKTPPQRKEEAEHVQC